MEKLAYTKRGPGRPRHSDPVTHVCLNMPRSLFERVEAAKAENETVQEYIRRTIHEKLSWNKERPSGKGRS